MFQPSEYTALMLSFLRDQPEVVRGRDVCEIGIGNGVIAAQAGLVRASRLTITGIEEMGVAAARECLSSMPTLPLVIEYLQGPVWEPAGTCRNAVVMMWVGIAAAVPALFGATVRYWPVGPANQSRFCDPGMARF